MVCSAPAGAFAQIPHQVFDDSTQIASIDFRFLEGRSLDDSELRGRIALTDRGALPGLRNALSFLPLLSPVGFHPFDPLELQRDVVRLRETYQGFVGTSISYEVDFDEDANQVDVTFLIDEGRPIAVRSVEVVTSEGEDPSVFLPDDLRPTWDDLVRERNRALSGTPLRQVAQTDVAAELLRWWADRGWAFVDGALDPLVDSAAAAATLRMRLDPGPRARIGSVEVIGNEGIDEETILMALPFEVGDLYSESALSEGQRRLFALDLFRLVLVDAPRDQPHDSSAAIEIRVQESEPRLFLGEIGYTSAGRGISGGAEIGHRNFLGDARTVRAALRAETGLLALGGPAEQAYSITMSYARPFFFDPRLSFSVGPYARYRDDVVDRSWEAGLETTFVYELGIRRYLTLQHRFSSRNVLEYRLGAGGTIDLRTLLALLAQEDSIGTRIDRSVLGLSFTVGRFDPLARVRALQAQPLVEVTAPGPLNTVEFALFDMPVSGFLPLGEQTALAAAVRFGRVHPFGKSIRGDSIAGLTEIVQLRDVLLRAGGTGSVRGWGRGMLGPKSLDLLFTAGGEGDSVAVSADQYLPSGGLARGTASVELRLPFPGLSEQWGTHVFLDAGRVWSPDARFRELSPGVSEGWFFSTGAGIDLSTVAGPVRLSVGYKLNPSPLDLRDPSAVLDAIMRGDPIGSVEEEASRRFHLHVALGLPS